MKPAGTSTSDDGDPAGTAPPGNNRSGLRRLNLVDRAFPGEHVSVYRLRLGILIFAAGVSGCGDVDPLPSPATSAVASSSPTADAGPTPTSATTSTTTTPPPPTTTTPPTTTADSGALDRSVLTLGLGNETSGRFELMPNAASRLSRTQGSYWVMEDGNVFTRFDLDPGVIGAEVGRLAERLSTDYPDLAGTSLLSALSDHHPGVEFQLGITDVIRWYDQRVPSLEVLEQATVILGAGVFADGSVPPDCRRNLTVYETAARAWVWELDPELGAGTSWAFPIPDYDSALVSHRADLQACEEPMAEQLSVSPPEVEFRVSARGGSTDVEVLADDGLYSDHDPTPVFTVSMQPDASVGEIPEPRDPEPLLGFASTYLAAVGACGDLPWAHSEMAGGDSWVDPDEEPLIGITFLADRLLCAGDVPEEAISP